MNIVYTRYGRNSLRVSKRWAKVLRAADRDKVRFTLTSGHRTLAEQTVLFRRNMRWTGLRWVQRPGRPLTAFPTPMAPHIRTGRHAHAIDINSLDGGETRLQKWLERKGAHPSNPVAGESWHLELSGPDLRRLARRLR